MKASTAAPTLPIPNPEDWCSVKWAADRLNRSERTVRRMARDGVLKIYSPRVATSGEHSDMCWVPQIEAIRDALMTAGRLIRKTGWRADDRTTV